MRMAMPVVALFVAVGPAAGQKPVVFKVGGTVVAGHGVTFRQVDGSESVRARTDANGKVELTGKTGDWRVISDSPYVREGNTYSWNFRIDAADTSQLEVSESDAVVVRGSSPRGVKFGLSVAARLRFCANAKTFIDLLVQDKSNSTGFISGRYSCVEGLLSLWVTNVWYEFRCHEKKQTYIAIRDAWRRQGGSNLVLREGLIW